MGGEGTEREEQRERKVGTERESGRERYEGERERA